MTNQNIYRQELMDIYKNPPNKGRLDNPSVEVKENNPMCGDEIVLTVRVLDGKIIDAKFDGSSCAVSVISSAFVIEKVIGMSVVEAKKISRTDVLKELDLNLSTSRLKCASLVFTALQKALEKYELQDHQ